MLKVDSKELAKIGLTLGELSSEFKTITSDSCFLNDVGQLLVSRGKQNLEDGGMDGKSYQLLAASTVKQKRRQGYSLKPLQRTGLMKRSLNHQVSGGLKLMGLDIIKHHQYGAPKGNLPMREVFAVAKEDYDDIRDFLVRRFKQITDK